MRKVLFPDTPPIPGGGGAKGVGLSADLAVSARSRAVLR